MLSELLSFPFQITFRACYQYVLVLRALVSSCTFTFSSGTSDEQNGVDPVPETVTEDPCLPWPFFCWASFYFLSSFTPNSMSQPSVVLNAHSSSPFAMCFLYRWRSFVLISCFVIFNMFFRNVCDYVNLVHFFCCHILQAIQVVVSCAVLQFPMKNFQIYPCKELLGH